MLKGKAGGKINYVKENVSQMMMSQQMVHVFI